MKQLISTVLITLTAIITVAQTTPQKLKEVDFTIGKTITLKSEILKENRDINVYLPLNYEADSLKTYPVIYLLDGSKDEDFIHVAGIVQFGSFSWINMVPETIVVGIANIDRKRDFTYPSGAAIDQKELPTSGGSKNFIQFIEKELQPFITSNFRTTNTKTLIGQSLGGLLATEILFKAPQLFDNYVIVSPSLWWDDEKLLQYKLTEKLAKTSVYIAVGKEGSLMERVAKELHVKLKQLDKSPMKLYFEYFEDKTHGDVLHQAAYNALEKLFKQENDKAVKQ